ncbi:cyclin-dependent kinase inhibitor 3 family protein [Roseomonas xinghualingensis]|uniref:cyclin-dependent kinase inhibitor 3 family protein n=1 Tax=Roseomonas xinghualingensis TaxID=2986475 RepID=UPI0021F20F76|nr:cyclin-dependent kinase inhibitor 3 family protein [Roseomonas sp. SXEYE001]MCV4210348.1 cyclin-dependent kinase inhibitor 3 family protein [Roseomonas sp. SXEYE001]
MSQTVFLTSETHPLRIEPVAAPGGGLIGMTFCPGKVQSGGLGGNWRRDLVLDLDAVRDWGAVAVVTLMEEHELARYRVAAMGEEVRARGMDWLHLPIVDADVPNEAFEALWKEAGPRLLTWLGEGRRILLHCRGGLGRTGLVAARLLIELGMEPGEAVKAVRAARRGTIETRAQEAYVMALVATTP